MLKKYTFENEDHTLGGLLRKEILNDSNVEFSAYKKIHPLTKTVELTIVSDSPNDSFNNAISQIKKDIKKLRKGWEKIK